jgi:hemin uptake protein HemP
MDPPREVEPEAPAVAGAASAEPSLPQWTVQQLLKGGKEAIIVHGDARYRLRLTRSGKLILFK